MISLRLLFAALLLLTATSCTPVHDDPPLYTYDTSALALLSAQAHAKDIGGTVYTVANTHSMEPALWGGDYVVVDTHFAFANLAAGQIILYHAGWSTADAPPVIHRTHDLTPTGWSMQGDNNSPDELHMWRVNAKDYIGKVVGIYRIKL